MERDYFTMVGLLHFMNERFVKKGGGRFTLPDVQGYTLRGNLPCYLGKVSVKKTRLDVEGLQPVYYLIYEG
jgi:hypothetical protein